MSAETKYKYSDKDLAIFKKLITEKINKFETKTYCLCNPIFFGEG